MSRISNKTGNLSKNHALNEKLREKFGDKFTRAKEKNKQIEDKVEISNKAKSDKYQYSDIEDNNPSSELTQAKLKGLLQTGAFHFSDKERAALSEILDV